MADPINYFFEPGSIAVIGASRSRGSIGGELFHNIIESNFTGVVFPVNINASSVQSVAAYHSVLDCPGEIDLGIIVVPASSVLRVSDECIRKGAKALIVISSGFSETGEKGRELQDSLLSLCRKAGVRLIGPNCMGVATTDPAFRLNAQFSPQDLREGRVSFLSQSGALGIVTIDLANRLGLGMSKFVSVGNKADVSSNDLIEYWEKDDMTDIIMLYLESFGNPRKFSRIARRVSKSKPILAVKGGRTAAGFRATQSHTGALLSSSDITVDALFRQCGVIRTDTLQEMFDAALLLSSQRPPKGRGVAIITNAGGAGILASDACEAMGLQVPELSTETQQAMRSFLPAEAAFRNPVDMTANDVPGAYEKAIKTVSKDSSISSIYVIYVPALSSEHARIAREIMNGVMEASGNITFLSNFMANHGFSEMLTSKDGKQIVRVPSFPFPEDGARALAYAARYSEWQGRTEEMPSVFTDIDSGGAASLLSHLMSVNREDSFWLDERSVETLLSFYGLKVAQSFTVKSASEAEDAASRLGGKVVLKAISSSLIHKTEAGGVKVGLDSSNIGAALNEMLSRLSDYKDLTFLVQKEITDALEMFVGVTSEGSFGPVIACGLGGIYVELLKDVSMDLAPITRSGATRMIEKLRTYQLIKGYRGDEGYDENAFIEVLERVSQLVEDNLNVFELDLNPVMLGRKGKGAVVVDARIRLKR